MEKKNTILLTVIAVATLLVAVVGATFAYFTASVNTTNPDNSETKVTTQTMVTATMDMGSKVTATNALPGHTEIKTVKVTGSGVDANSRPVDTVISVTANIPAAFGSDVTWELYEFDGDKTFEACTNTPNTTGTNNKYFETATCPELTGTPVLSSTSEPAKTSYDLKVAYNTKKTYVLKVAYANTDSVQNPTGANNQSGQSYSVTLGFASK